ncbi:MAG: biopolymer transporter ExbD [Phycisphaerales bacterium]|jgi:biopolymer transport protein ExbD|nr:biopolymer transporter ExbD [Phycisphaerales bacterium]
MILQPSNSDQSVGVDLTPVIDMVFMLLIFFLVATTFQQQERESKIALPQAAASAPISSALREIVINVTRDGTLIVNTKVVDEASLLSMLKSAAAQNPGQKVNVRGDRDAAYGMVARALDLCKQAGIAEPFLQTIPTR